MCRCFGFGLRNALALSTTKMLNEGSQDSHSSVCTCKSWILKKILQVVPMIIVPDRWPKARHFDWFGME